MRSFHWIYRAAFLIPAAALLILAHGANILSAQDPSGKPSPLMMAGYQLRADLRLTANDITRLKVLLENTKARAPQSASALDDIRGLLVGKDGKSGLRSGLLDADRELDAALKELAKMPDPCKGAKIHQWTSRLASKRRLRKTLQNLEELLPRSNEAEQAGAGLRPIEKRIAKSRHDKKGLDARQALLAYRTRHAAILAGARKRLTEGLRKKAFTRIDHPDEKQECSAEPEIKSPAADTGKGAANRTPQEDAADIIKYSPTLTTDLDKLQEEGYIIEFGTPGGGTYVDKNKKLIVIDGNSRGAAASITTSLAHEVGHTHYEKEYTPPEGLTKDEYVNENVRGKLAGEGEATLYNIQIRDEISANQGPTIMIAGSQVAKYEEVYKKYPNAEDRQTARDAVGSIFADNERPSTDPSITYREYYGAWYEAFYDQWAAKDAKNTAAIKSKPGIVERLWGGFRKLFGR